jgi:hypothetical protein
MQFMFQELNEVVMPLIYYHHYHEILLLFDRQPLIARTNFMPLLMKAKGWPYSQSIVGDLTSLEKLSTRTLEYWKAKNEDDVLTSLE